MRPIAKGASPTTYSDYRLAQPDLIVRLGRFCSYCDRFIAAAIHVEHKRPKKTHPAFELDWSNFLLACSNCNSDKGHSAIRLHRYLWPDTDNTLRAFEYLPGGVVRASRAITRRLRRKANKTLQLYGLDRRPGGQRQPTDRDYRWRDRREQWDKATTALRQLKQWDTPSQREFIVRMASEGMFSIWWTVFEHDADMRKRLRQAFIGTDPSCFNPNEHAVQRPGGQL